MHVHSNYLVQYVYKRICDVIVDETTFHKRQNDTAVNNYKQPYGLKHGAIYKM